MRIVLASASPRRQILLKQIGIPFEVVTDETPEDTDPIAKPSDVVYKNAVKKAYNVMRRIEEPVLIIAADTVVSIDETVIGKPIDEADATQMLHRLSGRCHEVYTGVCLLVQKDEPATENNYSKEISFISTANVFMSSLTDSEIESYIKTGEPMDKAGAYGIQGLGSVFVEKIIGDYYTVMGLPIARLYAELKKLGISINWEE